MRTRKANTAVQVAVDRATVEAELVVRLHRVKGIQVERAAATRAEAAVARVLWEATAQATTEELAEPEPLPPSQAVRSLAPEAAVARGQAATVQAAQVAVVRDQRLVQPHPVLLTRAAAAGARELERAVQAAAVSSS